MGHWVGISGSGQGLTRALGLFMHMPTCATPCVLASRSPSGQSAQAITLGLATKQPILQSLAHRTHACFAVHLPGCPRSPLLTVVCERQAHKVSLQCCKPPHDGLVRVRLRVPAAQRTSQHVSGWAAWLPARPVPSGVAPSVRCRPQRSAPVPTRGWYHLTRHRPSFQATPQGNKLLRGTCSTARKRGKPPASSRLPEASTPRTRPGHKPLIQPTSIRIPCRDH